MQDVKTLRRWMVFKLTPRPNGSVEKQPLSVLGGFASSNDPATWSSYETARKYCVEHSDCSLGFVLGKEVGLAVVDIDKARASKEQPWPAWVEREVEELDSFTEESVSGLGLHVWVWGSVPANRNNQKCHVEVHDSAKMFCVSQAFAERWEEIKPRDLSLLYRRIDAGEVGPSYHKPIVAYAWNEGKFRELLAGRYEQYFSSKSEAVASALCTLATKHAGDADKMRAEFEASELCALWNGKWERLGEREIERAIKWWGEHKAEHTLPAFKFPEIEGPDQDYVLLPNDGEFSGWFGRGLVHVIAGASGAGKSTIMLQMLDAQSRGEIFHGHRGARRKYLLIWADRGPIANRQTLRRMGLDNAHLPIAHIPVCWNDEAPKVILQTIEDQGRIPEAVFVEGADMLMEDASKMRFVVPFLSAMQKIAAWYHLALILSVGSPKQNESNKVTLRRDNVYGSHVWSRMCDDIVIMKHVGDGSGPEREMYMDHRQCGPELFPLEFINGRLRLRVEEADDTDELAVWARDSEWFNVADAEGAHESRRWLYKSKAAVRSRVDELLKAKKLEKRNSAGKPTEYRWRRSA